MDESYPNNNEGYDNNVPVEKPDNHLVWAILSTVLCCWPLGIPAIMNAAKVDKLWAEGDYCGARDAADKAKRLILFSVGGFLVYCLFVLVFIFMD